MFPTEVALAATLRERKKLRTRREISDEATRLFAEHGFEAVTLLRIAEAAEVSVKTIFNHFGSKEDLYFDRTQELTAAMIATIADRPPGVTVLAALRALLVENFVPFPGAGWDALADPDGFARFARFLAVQDRSPALQARRLTLGEELGRALLPVLGAELRRDDEDPALRALVAMLVATLHLRDAVLREAVASGAPPPAVRAAVVTCVEEALDRLVAAFGDLDRPPGPEAQLSAARSSAKPG